MNEIAERYNQLAHTKDNLSCGKIIEHIDFHLGIVCVDLGCGRGIDTISIAERVRDSSSVIGIDMSENMISIARSTAKEKGLSNVEFVLNDLSLLPLADSSCDVCISNCVLNHISDKQKIWNEIYRILKRGGYFVISDIYSLDGIPKHISQDKTFISECWAGAIKKEDYMNCIKEAGFNNVEIIKESEPYLKKNFYIASFTIKGYK